MRMNRYAINAWLLVAVVVSIMLPTTFAVDEEGGCSVCGDGMEVGAPNLLFEFPGQPTVTCGALEDAGATGLIPLDQCPFLPNLINVCNCVPIGTPVAPVTPNPTPIPTIPASPFPEDAEGCSICGEGMQVGSPDSLFIFPGQPVVSCGQLQDAGAAGAIALGQCLFLPNLVDEPCNCVPVAPVAPLPPIPAPAPQTPFPTSEEGCSVCGDGMQVGSPNALFVFQGQPAVVCGQLQQTGAAGLIPLNQCPALSFLIDEPCNCVPLGTPVAPSPPFTSNPSPAPQISQPTHFCSICGEGLEVGHFNIVVDLTDQKPFSSNTLFQRPTSCETMMFFGARGMISPDECSLLIPLVSEPCNCLLTGTPVAPITPQPAFRPVDPPSDVDFGPPSDAGAPVDPGMTPAPNDGATPPPIAGIPTDPTAPVDPPSKLGNPEDEVTASPLGGSPPSGDSSSSSSSKKQMASSQMKSKKKDGMGMMRERK